MLFIVARKCITRRSRVANADENDGGWMGLCCGRGETMNNHFTDVVSNRSTTHNFDLIFYMRRV